jgi:hypothetical protein
LGIKHAFISLITDVGGPTYIQPTHWNAPLNAPPFRVFDWDPGATAIAASVPSHTTGALDSVAEFPLNTGGAGRGGFNFGYVDTIQLAVGVASALNCPQSTGSTAFRFQYMASGFPGSWYSFDATGGSAPFISVATANNASLYLASTNGLRLSASVTVSAAAKALPQPLTTRIAGFGGSASSTVGVGKIVVLGS